MGLQAICTAYGVEMASVLSEKEGTQIYNIFDVQSTRRASYCSTDSSGVCEYPYLGLKRTSGTSNTLLWKPNVKWTDGNSLDFTDWGSGEPDLCKMSFLCLLIFFIHWLLHTWRYIDNAIYKIPFQPLYSMHV